MKTGKRLLTLSTLFVLAATAAIIFTFAIPGIRPILSPIKPFISDVSLEDKILPVGKYLQTASLDIQNGNINGAIKQYKKAIELDNLNALAHYNLGVAYTKKGVWKKAIVEFKRAIKIDSKLQNAYYNLGIAYGMLEKWHRSAFAFNNALLLNSDDADTHYNLVLIGFVLHNKQLIKTHYKALKLLDPALALKIKEIQKA